MVLKFAANLAFMFAEEATLLGRYKAARDAGFRGVEVAFPYDIPLQQLVAAKREAAVEQVLINSWPGDLTKGELGVAIFPDRLKEFSTTLDVSIEYAEALNCERLHIVSGKQPLTSEVEPKILKATYENNLKFAVKRLEQENIVGLIEPINNFSVPRYYMNDFDKAIEVLQSIDSPNLKLQLDIFHLQHLCGNLTSRIATLLPYVGHIQIAQVPDRHEPNSYGEINYKYIFDLLQKQGYDGWVGCEYKPEGNTVKGLAWLSEYGFHL